MEIYLDNAATSHPKPQPVVDAVIMALTLYNGNPGRSGHRRALDGARILLNGREQLAALFGVEDPFRFIYAFNCTDALNLAIKGSLNRGDHVITTVLEHNSVLRVVTELQRSGQIELTLLSPTPDGTIDPETVRQTVKSNTRLVILTHASNVTGIVQPVEQVGKICSSLGIRYLIDGAQGAGCMPFEINSLGCDLYAFPGHKALLGLQGTGGLYIAPQVRLNTIREGGTGSSSDSMRQPDELPERYESGTDNLHGIAGLAAGVAYVAGNMGTIVRHENALTDQLIRGLSRIKDVHVYGPKAVIQKVGVTCFNAGDFTSSQMADALDRRGIAVRGGLHCAPGAHEFLGTLKRGAVRASVGYANTPEEIDRFLGVVFDIVRKGA